MKKKYISAELLTVSMHNSDIVTMSIYDDQSSSGVTLSAGRRFDEWYEGF